jgi:hypothetical protein
LPPVGYVEVLNGDVGAAEKNNIADVGGNRFVVLPYPVTNRRAINDVGIVKLVDEAVLKIHVVGVVV